MKTLYKTPTLAVVALAMSPFLVSTATAAGAAGQACAEAFVASLATPVKAAPRLKATRIQDTGMEYGPPMEMDLTAFNPATHAPVARAMCRLNSLGQVLSITAVPLSNNL